MDRDRTNEDARPQGQDRGPQSESGERGPGGPRGAGGGRRFGGGGPGGDGPRGDGPRGGGPRGGGGRRFGGGGGRGRGRKEPLYLPDEEIDYKDFQRLRRALDERGKISNRRKTNLTARQQRQLTVAIKRARHMALLPFVSDGRR